MTIIYIAGPISGLPDGNKPAFDRVETVLSHAGYVVMSPHQLPKGMPETAYMDICLAMVRACDAVLLLHGWERSLGVAAEHAYAKKLGKDIRIQAKGIPGRADYDACLIAAAVGGGAVAAPVAPDPTPVQTVDRDKLIELLEALHGLDVMGVSETADEDGNCAGPAINDFSLQSDRYDLWLPLDRILFRLKAGDVVQ